METIDFYFREDRVKCNFTITAQGYDPEFPDHTVYRISYTHSKENYGPFDVKIFDNGCEKTIGQNPDFPSKDQTMLDLMDTFFNTFDSKNLEIFYDKNES